MNNKLYDYGASVFQDRHYIDMDTFRPTAHDRLLIEKMQTTY